MLLDTHIWLWYARADAKNLRPQTLKRIEAARGKHGVLVSAITIWEIGMLEAKNRITLSIPCETWIEQALQLPGLTLAELTPRIAVAASRLPGQPPPDPADRILIATARELDCELLTADESILEYGQSGHVRLAAT